MRIIASAVLPQSSCVSDLHRVKSETAVKRRDHSRLLEEENVSDSRTENRRTSRRLEDRQPSAKTQTETRSVWHAELHIRFSSASLRHPESPQCCISSRLLYNLIFWHLIHFQGKSGIICRSWKVLKSIDWCLFQKGSKKHPKFLQLNKLRQIIQFSLVKLSIQRCVHKQFKQ